MSKPKKPVKKVRRAGKTLQSQTASAQRRPRKRTAQTERAKGGRDLKGPRGWLVPEMEGAYGELLPRETGARPEVATKAVAIPSSLKPEGTTLVQNVPKTVWRDLLTTYRQRKAAAYKRRALAAPIVPGGRNWLPLGPSVVLKGQTVGQQPVAGRVSGIAIAPGGQTIFAASANGGVFRSTDGGTSWKALMDGFDVDPTNFASASVVCGAIALNPAAPNRVYVGTGEGDTDFMFRNGYRIVNALPAYGVGPIKTDDAGTTWISEASNPDLSGQSFFGLAVDPTAPDNVLAATTNGLYRRVPAAGGNFQWLQQQQGTYCSVAVASATGTTRFLAAQWSGAVSHSTDHGQTWAPVGTGFPTANVGRIALGVDPGNTNLFYALVASSDGALLGLYRLDIAGGAWKKVKGVPDILLGKQGDYDLAISVAPGNDNIVYLGGDRTNTYPFSGNIQRCKIQASGGGFKVSNATLIGTQAHGDIHVLVHTPGDPTELWCGCDGGVFLNRQPQGTGQFASQNSGLSCLCSNFLAQHPTDPNVLFTGLQDNGTAMTTSGPIWTHIQDGDGGYCVVNWADPSRVLVYMNGGVYRSTDGGATFAPNAVWDFGWDTMTQPVVTTPYNPGNSPDAEIVAVGAGNQVYISQNFGNSWSTTLTLPGNDIGDVFTLAFASTNRIFAATTSGAVFRADQAGSAWNVTRLDNVSAGPLGLQGLISDLAIDWTDATRASVYVAFGGQGQDRRRVWRFDGTQWEARSGPDAGNNLLNVEHNAITVDPSAPDNVYVGADIGVWHSPDRGSNWEPLENGLPDSPVYDLQIHPTQRLLRAATHGRGIYEIPLN
jgi:photosystem II stability/assembly factor-like uncharacterized protein